MKYFILLFACLFSFASGVEAKKHILFVGSYTNGLEDGIFVYRFNDQTGKLRNLKVPVKAENPSFLAVSPDKRYLYAVNETSGMGVNRSGAVSAYKIAGSQLLFLNQALTYSADPCHVSVSPDGKKLVASNYTGGSLSFFRILPNGSLSEMVQSINHTGSGPVEGRQEDAHVHSAQFDAAGKNVYVADLGIDQIRIYSVTNGETPLVNAPLPFIQLPAGSGPRHFAFSSDGRFLYVINELNSTIVVLMKYGADWKEVQSVKTLPKDFKDENLCADIHLSADGKFVYGSNRGHNSIVVFKRNELNGKLELVQHVSVEGNWPRNFTIDPSGKFLLCANQRSNDITVFEIDQVSGKLRFTGTKVPVNQPACLKFL